MKEFAHRALSPASICLSVTYCIFVSYPSSHLPISLLLSMMSFRCYSTLLQSTAQPRSIWPTAAASAVVCMTLTIPCASIAISSFRRQAHTIIDERKHLQASFAIITNDTIRSSKTAAGSLIPLIQERDTTCSTRSEDWKPHCSSCKSR